LSLTLTEACPFITVSWSPLTVATIGSSLLFWRAVASCASSVGRGIFPSIPVAPTAIAAAPTPYLRKSLRDIPFFASSLELVFPSLSLLFFLLNYLQFHCNPTV